MATTFTRPVLLCHYTDMITNNRHNLYTTNHTCIHFAAYTVGTIYTLLIIHVSIYTTIHTCIHTTAAISTVCCLPIAGFNVLLPSHPSLPPHSTKHTTPNKHHHHHHCIHSNITKHTCHNNNHCDVCGVK